MPFAVGEKQQCKEQGGYEMERIVDDGAEDLDVHGRDIWNDETGGCRWGRHAESGRLPQWKRERQEQNYSFSPRATMNAAV